MRGVIAALCVATPALAQPANESDVATSCIIKPKRIVQLGSAVSGLLSNVLVDRGATVKNGQIVAKLESSVEEAQFAIDQFRSRNTTQIETAQVSLGFNQKELAQREQLRENLFAKTNDVERFKAQVAQDQISIRKAEADRQIATLEAERSQRQVALKQIRSSVDGVVIERKLSAGEHVYEQTPILTIAEVNPLFVELVVPADSYKSFKVGMTAEVSPSAPIGGSYAAKVDVVDPVIDSASNTFRVRLVLPNPGNAIPAGLRCKWNFATSNQK